VPRADRTAGEVLHAATLRGELDGVLEPAAELPPAWAELIACEHALATGAPEPSAAVHEPDAPGAWLLALFRIRTRVTGLRTGPLPAAPPHPIAGPLAHAWSALAEGVPFTGDLTAAATLARRDEWPALAVECAALAALLAARDGDPRAALVHARRASRMARTESLPQSEYLAGLVLARLRRLTAHPHLAGRILASLRALAPPHWGPWMEWELVLAGGTGPTTPGATALVHAREAASSADSAGMHAALAAAAQATQGFQLLVADARAVEAMLTPDAETTPEDERPFAAFAGDAYVLCSPDGPGRRIRAVALPFVDAARVDGGEGRGKRIATLAAVLGLAGGALAEDECFERVYGFAYVPEMHRGSFDVLLHRARAALEGHARVEREGDRVTMTIARPFVVPDPRMVEPAEARILRAIASGNETARDIAAATDLSLRQTQMLLKSLADEGECAAEKRGRAMLYRVEDTTFSEPTRAIRGDRNTPVADDR